MSLETEALAGHGERNAEAGEADETKSSTRPAIVPAVPSSSSDDELHDILYGDDESPLIWNADFLRAMCPVLPSGESLWITAFKGDPNSEDAKWRGWSSDDHGPSEQVALNSYFVISTIRTAGEERPSRRKQNFGRMFVVPLDDPEGALPLAPTYVLQTSLKKRQAGYRLATPISDAKTADRLIQEMVLSGRVDKVDRGGCNITRYVRLPIGCNTKASHVEANGGVPFETRLVEWKPERAYTVEELAHAFGLDLDFIEGRSQRPSSARRKKRASTGANTVITALRAKGLYKTALTDGKHDITCPWVKEHSNAVDGGTCYFEPSEEHPRGGFKCQHDHCADRHLKDLCRALGVDEPSAHDKEGRRYVFLRRGVRESIVEEVASYLGESDEVFSRGTTLATPAKVKEASLKSQMARSSEQTVILHFNVSRMLNTLSRLFACMSWSPEAGEWQPVDPPMWLATGLIDDPRCWTAIRPLAGVTNIPLLMLDGTIHDEPGYHAGTAMLYEPRGDISALPAACSREEARAALARFGEWLKHYPFAEESHRTAVLAMSLVALARHLFAVAPYLHIDAPKQGSGKTLIAEAIGILATGVRPPTHGYPTDPEETRKLLTSCLLAGDRVILFDNAKDGRVIDDPTLGQVVTSEKHGDRLLKTNDRTQLENLAIIIGTGNNNVLAGDLPRRALMPRITPDVERPEERDEFPWKPTEYVEQHRGEMVRDGLTILAAYLRAGRPQPDEKLSAWGSFESFALVRGALVWLGLPDPAEARARTQISESELAEEEVFRTLHRLTGTLGKRRFTVRDVMEESTTQIILDELMKQVNFTSLGQFLQSKRGQVRCGISVESTGKKRHGYVVWELRGDPKADPGEEDGGEA